MSTNTKDGAGAYSRTHVYLEDRSKKPKHMFVCIMNKIREEVVSRPFSLLDVGAASGDFLFAAVNEFPEMRATGVEFDPVLVEVAKRRVPQANHCVGDANKMDGFQDDSFEAVTLTGTHSIFDDFKPSFSECIRVAKPGGVVVVTGIFNSYPVDARIHWRLAGKDEDWHPGYNLFSEASVGSWLKEHPKVSGFAFDVFQLPFDLPPQEDPIRSWTYRDPSGERQLRNGIMPLDFKILTIQVREL